MGTQTDTQGTFEPASSRVSTSGSFKSLTGWQRRNGGHGLVKRPSSTSTKATAGQQVRDHHFVSVLPHRLLNEPEVQAQALAGSKVPWVFVGVRT